MMDIVNEYFHRFYPDDHASNLTLRNGTRRGMQYANREKYDTFPIIECTDGFSFSVQGHFGGYCDPCSDYAQEYYEVEVWLLSEPEPMLLEYGDGSSPYAFVPVSLVVDIINKHGGIKP